MRTTLTSELENADRLRPEANLGKRSFKQVVNDALRRGLGLEAPSPSIPSQVIPHSSAFLPGIDPGKLNQLADEIEALEIARKFAHQ